MPYIHEHRWRPRFGNLLEHLGAAVLFVLLIVAVALSMWAATCFLVAYAPWAFPLMVVVLALWCRAAR